MLLDRVISLAVVYLVAGGLYQKLARGATGWEIVPNRDMWMTVPELVTVSVHVRVHVGMRHSHMICANTCVYTVLNLAQV